MLAPLNSLLADPADPAVGGEPTGVAEVEGEPITAEHLRALLTALDAVCPGGLQAPTGGSLHLDLLGAGGACSPPSRRRELEQAVRRGCPQHPAVTAAARSWHDRRRPRATDRPARPAAVGQGPRPGMPPPRLPQQGRAGPTWTTSSPHADGGPTDCDNLCCLCRRHHRLKTHAPGWIFRLDADGALLVTTPTGVTRVSRPPGTACLEPYELGTPPPGRRGRRPHAVLNDDGAAPHPRRSA